MVYVIDVTPYISLQCVSRGWRRAGARPWHASGCIAEPEVVEPVTKGTGSCGSSRVPWWIMLVAEPKSNGAIAKFIRVVTICWSVARTTVHKPVIGVWPSLKWCSSVLGSTTVSQLPTCIPKLPQRHFCSWKTAKLLLEWRNVSREPSILPSYWCPSQAIFKKHV